MTTLSKQDVVDILQGPWGTYVHRFQDLSPEAQAAFLEQQGYARFADLLAHIVAWWEAGYQDVGNYLADPEFQSREYDVNAFNAQAVAKIQGLEEGLVIQAFEKMRGFLVEFVQALPGSAFENEKVIHQFDMDLLGHLREHELPGNG